MTLHSFITYSTEPAYWIEGRTVARPPRICVVRDSTLVAEAPLAWDERFGMTPNEFFDAVHEGAR